MTSNDKTKSPGQEVFQVEAALTLGQNRRMIGQLRDHTVVLDVSEIRGGENAGPTPPEFLLLSLGGCAINMVRVMAMSQGLETDGLEVLVSGDLDPSKAFGLNSENRAGFLGITLTIQAPREWSDQTRDTLLRQLLDRCPICDTVQNHSDLTIRFDTA